MFDIHHRRWLVRLVLFSLLLAPAACKPSTANPAANGAAAHATKTPIAVPTSTALLPTPSVIPPTATVAPAAALRPAQSDLAQLETLVRSQLKADQAASLDQPIGVSVLPLTATGTLSPLFAAYTTGSMLGSNPPARHVLGLYSFATGRWSEIKKLNLDNADYLESSGIQQVMIEPSHIWLEVQSGAGAHSGCYDLLAFDPASRSVSQPVSHCNSSPGAGHISDLDGDGRPDVVLDQSDYYVFCYACGVTHPQYSVLAWNGTQLSEVDLAKLTGATPIELQRLNDEAVQLAQAGLWKDAQTKIDQAMALKTDNPVVGWNAALIALHTRAHQAQTQEAQSYPLLNDLFYGDYSAAVNLLQPYPPDQIFSLTSPLIKGTVAEDWQPELANWITQTTNSAIQVQPNLAAAYFLRGWGEFLANAKDPAVRQDVARAAQFDPNEPLYAQSDVYLKR